MQPYYSGIYCFAHLFFCDANVSHCALTADGYHSRNQACLPQRCRLPGVLYSSYMSERLRGHDPHSHDREGSKEDLLPAYHQAARYADEAASEASFDQTQQAIYETPCDLATYRLLLMPDNLWHVVVLGDSLPDDLRQRLTDSLAAGELVSVPNDLLIALNQHRKAQPTIDGWAEHHALPRRRTHE
jgi:hypothetical protein